VEEEATSSLQTSSTKTYVLYDPTLKQGPYKTVHCDFDSDELTLELVEQPGTYVFRHTTRCIQRSIQHPEGIPDQGDRKRAEGTGESRRQPQLAAKEQQGCDESSGLDRMIRIISERAARLQGSRYYGYRSSSARSQGARLTHS
jgi:hypothetical protein